MKFKRTKLDGVFEIENDKFDDLRGTFVKPFNADIFKQAGLQTNFKESYYSISKKDVLRGMHFQLPPYDHAKLVYVTHGEVLDVVLDIRPTSKTFGQYYSAILSAQTSNSLYLERGFAHGFLTISNSATLIYQTTTVHAPKFDSGVLWNSFGFNWPKKYPIISERDKALPSLESIIEN